MEYKSANATDVVMVNCNFRLVIVWEGTLDGAKVLG
jgi:hypothetical protein